MGFAMSLIVARWMGPEEFGLFSLFIVILILGNDVLGEGLNPGVVRYYAMYSGTDREKASEVLTSALALRVLLGIPVVLIGAAAGTQVAGRVFQDGMYTWPVVLGLVGSLGAALWSFHLSTWQARQAFAGYAVMVSLVNALRVLSVPVLIWIGQLTLIVIMGLHVIIYYLCTAVAFGLLRRHFANLRINKALLRELLRFSKWPAMASLCFLLQVNLGVPILNYFVDSREAGLYAAGSALLMGVDFLTVSLLTTLLPKVSQFTGLEQCRSYVQRSFPLNLLIAAALLPLTFFGGPLVLLLFGPAYEGTIPVFHVLFFGALATLVTHPLYLVFYAMNRPHLYTLTGIVALIGWIVAGCWLIPAYGAVGAAWTTLIARLFQSIMIMVILWQVLGFGSSSNCADRSMLTDLRGS